MLQIPQTTVNNRPPVAFAGMLGDSGPWDIRSCLAEHAMDAGLGVVYGTQPSNADPGTPVVDLPANTGEVAKFMGVTQYLSQREPNPAGAARYAATDGVPTVRRGRVWVQVDATAGAALTAESAVAGGTAATLIPGAKVEYPGTEGGIALINLNLP